ncbi:MAG: translation elongation factor Ts [Clostridiales bacterium]|jgi:elongation factor Ts|nr:translation elongation factor Ts [Clostridiales bacterium]
MAFTAQDVAKLRELTGAGMMDCKRALTETDGDMEKAAVYLRENGVAVAAKKASRVASEGVVWAYTDKNGKKGALVEVNCESDFVAKGAAFTGLCESIAAAASDRAPRDLEALLQAKTADGATVQEALTAATAKIGEKISLRRFAFESADGRVESYTHMGGKIGVLLVVKTDKDINNNEEFATACHDVAMHIAAFSPKYTYDSEVPAAEVEAERGILRAQTVNDPKNAKKPAEIVEKMLEGRIKKFYKEICLIDQDFVKDPSVTVKGLFEGLGKRLGADIRIVKFERFVMGEGLEKKNENFAEEIAKLSGQR